MAKFDPPIFTSQLEGLVQDDDGIIWGDAKAANVLIDANEDAYLIDFGGGYTKGWVEKEKSSSTEGDLQGLENIKRYLFG
ncbi:hypothetical protein N7465_002725 [Penicillium sp. CMV-2018d]|nr:hypothetical protein N7465_002725 [Penicillium sp. CMV-2018d]